jgi:glutathione synthase/RimK-type ligase-like ATP-grasp enzyme
VPPEALDDLDGLRLCPMTFQERVEKRLELRVVAVGRQLFSAAVDSQAGEASREDWRRDGVGLIEAWRPYDLPSGAAAALHRLLDALGLNYASMDLILTPGGDLVFLEANPVGEYFWLEDHPGLSISAAIADVLLGRAPRR